MKKVVFIFLISLLIGTPQLLELLKLPILVEHYYEHQQNDPKLNLITFLFNHYIDETSKIHPDKDMKLPFKTSNTNIITYLAVLNINNSIKHKLPEIAVKVINQYHNMINYRSNYLSFIWQPPKLY